VRSWHRPISDNTLNAALRRLGYDKTELTIHGLRSTASTLLNESGKWHADVIERQLAHQEANEIRGAYTHAAEFAIQTWLLCCVTAALQAEAPVPSQCPLDATIVTLKPGDVLPDALLEDRLPRHQLEAESILDHGEASAD
jgi:hypothetical protein